MERRTFLKSTGILALSMVLGKWATGSIVKTKNRAPMIKNPELNTILSSWEGNPIDENGRFVNHEFPMKNSFGDALKWMLQRNPNRKIKKEDKWRMQVVKDDSFLRSKEDVIVLLGHASFFIRLGGRQVLIDPIMGSVPLKKRYTEFPIATDKLVDIDYVLVSHAHYDHCDKASLVTLHRQNPNAKFLTGLNMSTLLKDWVKTSEIQEAGWYQEYNLDDSLQIYFLPSRHWSNRRIGDENAYLWGAFVLKSGERTIYFGGDSGYGSHFKEVGELFPNIDVALIGAGAYAPRWFMSPNHQDPEHAVRAFNDTKAKMMVPFHYGTFDMSDEPLSEPEAILKSLARDNKVQGELKIAKVGEALSLG
jgi:L-ascorbate metabolism protein UlaG (beta-lactamase superfamily)